MLPACASAAPFAYVQHTLPHPGPTDPTPTSHFCPAPRSTPVASPVRSVIGRHAKDNSQPPSTAKTIETIPIAAVYVHPQYNGNVKNDNALVRPARRASDVWTTLDQLGHGIEHTPSRRVLDILDVEETALVDGHLHTNYTVAGWGTISPGDTLLPEHAQVRSMDTRACDVEYDGALKVSACETLAPHHPYLPVKCTSDRLELDRVELHCSASGHVGMGM